MVKEYNRNRSSRSSGKFLGILASFLGGYLLASFFDFTSLSAWVNQEILHKNTKKPEPQIVKNTKLPKPKFEFYTLLTKESGSLVPVKPIEIKPIQQAEIQKPVPTSIVEPTPVSNTKREIYQVQVAAFNKKQDAEQLKASLLLKGYDAAITPVPQGQITWFRVIIGPFPTRVEAEKAQGVIAKTQRMRGIIKKIGYG